MPAGAAGRGQGVQLPAGPAVAEAARDQGGHPPAQQIDVARTQQQRDHHHDPASGRRSAEGAVAEGFEVEIDRERQAIISSVAAKAACLSTPPMLDGGKFTFPQEAYVAVARPSD